MTKIRFFMDFEKEERWLNAMSLKGWALAGFFFIFYRFVPCEMGEYIYRIDLLDDVYVRSKSQEYVSSLRESGIEFVTGYTRWAYFRKRAADGPFELYSDTAAQIIRYTKLIEFFGTLALFELLIGISNSLIGLSNTSRGFTINLWVGLILLLLSFCMFILVIRYRGRIAKLRSGGR